MDDMVFTMNEHIKYHNCKSGDPSGILVCKITTRSGCVVEKSSIWDNTRITEVQAIFELENFIKQHT